jgi:C_GCAxxG_C_C family probable redox protein
MDEIDIMIADLASTGKNCSQIMCRLMQEITQKENEELIKVLYSLGNGVHSGKMCGIITGGAVAINLLAKDDSPEERAKFKKIINEFVEWFESTFNSVECKILDPQEKREVCPVMLKESFLKILSLLEENNIDLYE